jgi:hypothetical protein
MKEGRKVVCLFCFVCFVLMRSFKLGCVLGFFGKFLRRRGSWAWFHGVWTCGVEVLEY